MACAKPDARGAEAKDHHFQDEGEAKPSLEKSFACEAIEPTGRSRRSGRKSGPPSAPIQPVPAPSGADSGQEMRNTNPGEDDVASIQDLCDAVWQIADEIIGTHVTPALEAVGLQKLIDKLQAKRPTKAQVQKGLPQLGEIIRSFVHRPATLDFG